MFLQIEKWLRSENAKQKEHGEIESMLMKDGMELLRLLFQGFLDQQSKEEVMECEIVGADGTTRTHRRRHCSRQMETLFGTVSVDRLGYSAAGVASVYPLDGQLNLPPDKYSHGIRRLVAEEASKVSFDETVKSIGDMTGGEIPKRQAEQLVVQAAQDFEAFYEVGGVDEAEKTDDPLVITMDSKGIVMRKDDLREETKKRAEKQQGERKARLGKGEKRNRKRMATVASVYTIERQPRTAGEIMEANAKEKDPKIKPKARGNPNHRPYSGTITESVSAHFCSRIARQSFVAFASSGSAFGWTLESIKPTNSGVFPSCSVRNCIRPFGHCTNRGCLYGKFAEP